MQEDAHEFNASSSHQMQQLLFAPFNKKRKKPVLNDKGEIEYEYPKDRYFKVENALVRGFSLCFRDL